MQLYIGTSGYGYKEWKGKFYPEKITSGEMLGFYATRFDTVEINNTFYRMPRQAIVESWAAQVPENFIFAAKAPQVITHLKQLRNISAEVDYLFTSLSVLNRKQGPVLFQFPKSFHPDPVVLRDFLDLIPGSVPCAFEFRSRSRHDEKIPDLLRERGHCLCIVDTDKEPAPESISTGSWGYIRLRKSDYAYTELSQWRERILSQKWDKAFVFFKHEEAAKGPILAMKFRDMIDARAKTKRSA